MFAHRRLLPFLLIALLLPFLPARGYLAFEATNGGPVTNWDENGFRVHRNFNMLSVIDGSNSSYARNGTDFLLFGTNTAGIEPVITSLSGAPFDAQSVDLAEISTFLPGPKTVRFVGTKITGDVVNASFTTDGIFHDSDPTKKDFQKFTFPATFRGLVDITILDGDFSMDNLNLNFTSGAVGGTGDATDIGPTFATLHGKVYSNGNTAQPFFDFGRTPAYANSTAATPSTVAGSSVTDVSVNLTNLDSHVIYHYRIRVVSPGGTGFGLDQTFVTGNVVPVAAPDSVELPMVQFNVKANDSDGDSDPIVVTAVGDAAHGTTTLNPNNTITYLPDATFTGTDTFSYTLDDQFGGVVFGTVTVSDTTPPVLDTKPAAEITLNAPSANHTAPTPNFATSTTYHDNSGLVTYAQTPTAGTVLSLGDTIATITVTDNAGLTATTNVTIHVVSKPTVVTSAASDLVLTSATLNATVNPNKQTTMAWFEYGLTNTYGSSTTPQDLGNGTGDLPLTAALGNLAPHTTYFFRAVAQNATGTTNGVGLVFVTGNGNPVAAPDTIAAGNSAITFNPLVNDMDPDGDAPLSVTGVGAAAHGTVSFKATSVTYKPTSLGTGTDTFTYTVGDGFGGTAQAAVKVYSLGSQGGFFLDLLHDAGGTNGLAQITLARTGKLTGRVDLLGAKYSFKAALKNGLATIKLGKAGTLHLQLLVGDAPAFAVSITDRNSTVLAEATLPRAETTVPAKVQYTMAFPPDPAQAGSTAIPQGTGYALVTLDVTGRFVIAGKLGDGTAFSTASALRADTTFPFYAGLYSAPHGQIFGNLTREDIPGSDFDGVLTWIKPAQNKPKPPQATGFITTTAAFGSLYAPPIPAQNNLMLDFNSTGDATLAFTAGDLASPVNAQAQVGPRNPAKVTAPLTSLKFTPKTGLLTGAFKSPTGPTRKFTGVVLQKTNNAQGHFLTPTQSGTLTLTPSP